jgi:hypothetical protein
MVAACPLFVAAACQLSGPPIESSPRAHLPPRQDLPSGHILAAPVLDGDGVSLGNVADLWVDSGTGAVVAVVVRQPAATADAEAVEHILEPSALKPDLQPPSARDETQRPLHMVTVGPPVELEDPKDRQAFEGQTPSEVEGQIRAIERVQGDRLEVRLLDSENLMHRVRIEAAALVTRRAPRLAVGESVSFQAVEARDDRGKLWIPSALAQDGVELALRDENGRLLWRELGCFQAKELLTSSVRTADGRTVAVREWFLDPTATTVVLLVLELEGVSYQLHWSELVRDPEGGWRTPRLLSELPRHDASLPPRESSRAPERPPERPLVYEQAPTG